jgi:hypothetical protein
MGLRVPTPVAGLAGGGLVAAGVGGVFGLLSRTDLDAARKAPLRDEMVLRHGHAVGNARVANILFGTAGVLATSALVTWAFSSPDQGLRGEVSP